MMTDGCWSCIAEPAEESDTGELCSTSHVGSWHVHVSVCAFFFFLHFGHCVHTRTFTNRKWCQSLSPGRQRRLLRYRDSGFLFLSFSSAPLSHGLTQIDTSPSVAGVHPSHPLITGRPSEPRLSFTLSSSLSLSPSPSICLYLTIELLAPVWAHKFFSISFNKSKNVHRSMWWTVVVNKMVTKVTSNHDGRSANILHNNFWKINT